MQCRKCNFFCNFICITYFFITTSFFDCFKRIRMKRIYQIICIYDCTFATFHSARRKVYKTIAQMIKFVTPFKSKFFKNVKQNFKMIILFRSYDVYKLVKRPVIMTADCSTNILRNINRSPVFTKKDFFVVFFVFSFAYNISYVNTHRAVISLKENTLFKTF